METKTQHGPGLGIRLAGRTWATRHLVAGCTVALVAGMMIGYSGKKPSAGDGAAKPIVALGSLTSPAPAGGTTSTTDTTATTGTTATTSPAATEAKPTVLMANTPGQGPSELPVFAAGGPWSIGWHFRCVNAPGGTGTFTLQVIPAGDGAPQPAVEQTSREAQGISPEAAPGRQHLKIITDPACQWAVKVTGIGP
ncbi:MAG TPA: hypothetical protein VGO87_04265 [Acidimicrobiia bacterium]